METRAGFNIDGIEVKVSHRFGAGWLDYRSWVKNPGPAPTVPEPEPEEGEGAGT